MTNFYKEWDDCDDIYYLKVVDGILVKSIERSGEFIRVDFLPDITENFGFLPGYEHKEITEAEFQKQYIKAVIES